MLKNILLMILTLGIYTPWARTNMRRYIWGNISVDGDRLVYVGTGEELFKGWVKLMLILMGIGVVEGGLRLLLPSYVAWALPLLVLVAYVWLASVAIYSGYRYLMSRSKWREITFGVERTPELAKEFMKLYLKGTLLSMITLGIYAPYFMHNINKFLTDRSRFGSGAFRYTGDASEYFWLVSKGLLLTLITLGVYFPWFKLQLSSYRLGHTRLQDSSIRLNLRGGELLWYTVASFLLTIITVGIALPWIKNWGLKLLFEKMELVGELDLAVIAYQDHQGEALADAAVSYFDLDFGF